MLNEFFLLFANPVAFWLMAFILPVVFFYFLRLRFRNQPVGSVFIWKRIVSTSDGGKKVEKRSMLLLFLQLATLVFLVFGLTAPFIMRSGEGKVGVAILVDNSASMGSVGRMDEARSRALAYVAKLDPVTPVRIFACADHAREVGGGGIAGILAGDSAFQEEAVASDLLVQLKDDGIAWKAVLFSDGGLDLGGTHLAGAFKSALHYEMIGQFAPNSGIFGLQTEAPGGQAVSTISFESWNSGSATLEVPVTISWKKNPLAEPVKASQLFKFPQGPARHSWSLPAKQFESAYGYWELSMPGNDTLPSDDICRLSVDTVRPARVLVVGEDDRYLHAALASNGIGYETMTRLPAAFEAQVWDLVIMNGLPAPAGLRANVLSLSAAPSGSSLFIGPAISGQLEIPDRAHPLSSRLAMLGGTAYQILGLIDAQGFTVLARIDNVPVLLAREQGGYKTVVHGFVSADADRDPVFPLVMHNALSWLLVANNPGSQWTFTAGIPAQRPLLDGWKPADDSYFSIQDNPGSSVIESYKAGVFTWNNGSRTAQVAVNVPASESDLAVRQLYLGPYLEPVATGQHAHGQAFALFFLMVFMLFLVIEWFSWRGRRPGLRCLQEDWQRGGYIRLFLVMRAFSLLLALVALFGPMASWPEGYKDVALMIDCSDSVDVTQREKAREHAIALVNRLSVQDKVSLYLVASDAQELMFRQEPKRVAEMLVHVQLQALQAGDGAVTNLEAAFRTVAAHEHGSYVLFSDGRVSQGNLAAVMPQLEAPVDVVALGVAMPVIRSLALDLPEFVQSSDRVPARWRVESDVDRTVLWRVLVDGKQAVEGTVGLKPGSNTIALTLPAGEPGERSLSFSLYERSNTAQALLAVEALLPVNGSSAVLVVKSGKPSLIAESLRQGGYAVNEIDVSGMSEDRAGYASVSAVIMDDVPALFLGGAQIASLRSWVLGGGSLLVSGGLQSLGRGEYYDTELESMIPVETDVRRRLFFSKTRILFLLDNSGSMSERAGVVSKQYVAMQGIAAAVKNMNPQDEVGILSFDSGTAWVQDFTSSVNQEEVLKALSSVNRGGSTNIAKALEDAQKGFGPPGPVRRHVVLLTDGQTGQADFKKIMAGLRANDISLTAIGIGDTVDEKLLASLAEWGEGSYYRASDNQIPAIINRETIRVTRELTQEGVFPVQVVDAAGMFGESVPRFPPVTGYLLVKLKERANLHLGIDNGTSGTERTDPLLASWSYGAGTVMVFAADGGQRWLSGWKKQAALAGFWQKLAASLVRPAQTAVLYAQATVGSGVDVSRIFVRVQARSEDQRLISGLLLRGRSGDNVFALKETVPGWYEAAYTPEQPGLHVFEIGRAGRGDEARAWVWVEPVRESRDRGPDHLTLGYLTSNTGGSYLKLDSQLSYRERWLQFSLGNVFLIVCLLVFVVELGARSTVFGQFRMALESIKIWLQRSRQRIEQLHAQHGEGDMPQAMPEETLEDSFHFLALQKRKQRRGHGAGSLLIMLVVLATASPQLQAAPRPLAGDWLVIGSWDLSQDSSGLAQAIETATAAEGLAEEYLLRDGRRWTKIASGDGTIDFQVLIGAKEQQVAYAYHQFDYSATDYAASAGHVVLKLGSDDGCRVWLNGKEVFAVSGPRGLRPGENSVRVQLKQGVNTLVTRVEQFAAGWGFQAMINDLEHEARQYRQQVPDRLKLVSESGYVLAQTEPSWVDDQAVQVRGVDIAGRLVFELQAKLGERLLVPVVQGFQGAVVCEAVLTDSRLSAGKALQARSLMVYGDEAQAVAQAALIARWYAAMVYAGHRDFNTGQSLLAYHTAVLSGDVDAALRTTEHLREIILGLQALCVQPVRNPALNADGSVVIPPTGWRQSACISPIDGSAQPFSLWVPPDYNAQKSYPLLISLHGHGGNDRMAITPFAQAMPQDVIVVAPFGRGDLGYRLAGEMDVLQVVAGIQKQYNIDDTRIWLFGHSMGGMGAWYLAHRYPDKFAAIASFAGWTGTALLGNVANLPSLLVHGSADSIVPERYSARPYKALLELGASTRYDQLEAAGHDVFPVWARAEGAEKLLAWFRTQVRNDWPDTIRFTMIPGSRAGQAYWLKNLIPGNPAWKAKIEAQIVDDRHVQIRTVGMAGFSLLANHPSLAKQGRIIVAVNDRSYPIDAGTAIHVFVQRDNAFLVEKLVDSPEPGQLAGAYGTTPTGGIESLFDRPMFIVYGTINPERREALKALAYRLADWKRSADIPLGIKTGRFRVCSDQDPVLETPIGKAACLLLLGGPGENVLAPAFLSMAGIVKLDGTFRVNGFSEKVDLLATGLIHVQPDVNQPQRLLGLVDLPLDTLGLDDWAYKLVSDLRSYPGNEQDIESDRTPALILYNNDLLRMGTADFDPLMWNRADKPQAILVANH